MEPSSNPSPAASPGQSEPSAGRWPGFFAVLAAAVCVRAICLTQLLTRLPFYQSTTPGWDQDAFFHWAQKIAAGDLLSRHQGIFTYTPLYPYVLSTVCLLAGWTGGNALIGGIVLNGLLGVAMSLMVWSMARRFFGNGAGVAAGLLMAASGSHIAVEGMLVHDTLMTFLLIAGLWLIVRKVEPAGTGGSRRAGTSGTKTSGLGPVSPAYWLLPGAAFGLAAIGRTSHVVLAAGMCVWLLAAGWRQGGVRRGLVGAAMLALAATAAVALPAVRNGLMFSRWSSGSGGWSAVYLGITPDAPGTLFETARYQEAANRVHAATDPSVAWRNELIQLVRDDPRGVSRTIGWNTLTLLTSWDAPDNGNYYFVRRYVPAFAWGTFGPLVIYVLGFGGVIVCLLGRRRLGVLYAFGLSFLISLVPAYPSGRYKLALLCLLCLFGGQAVMTIVSAVRQRRWLVIAGTAALWALLAIGCWPRGPWAVLPSFQAEAANEPWFKPARLVGMLLDSGPLRENEFQYHAIALKSAGRADEAAAMLDDGADLFPQRVAPAGFDGAQAKLATGAFADAIDLFGRIIARHPNYWPAYNGRGLAHSQIAEPLVTTGRRSQADYDLEQALADFTRAIELDKDRSNPAPRYNRGTVLEWMMKYDQALRDLDAAIALSPSSIRYLYARGRVHAKNGDYAASLGDANTTSAELAAAIRDFSEVIRLDPARAEAFEARSLAYQGAGQTVESDRDLATAKGLRRGKP
jgi:tetratricopeptide (TPR) repeat protein/4-amino-4-deoxy-L-arabinose transferase-like glycosyltransferase